MNKKILWGIVVVVVIGGLYILNNKSQEESSSNQSVKIGFMLPLSGQFAGFAEGIKNSGMIAVEEYKISHPNTNVEVIFEDDAFDVKKGISAYTKLVTLDKVSGILMMSTPLLDAIHEKMNTDGIPIVSIGLQDIGVGNDNIFQTTLAPIAPIEYLAKQVKSEGYKKIAVIHNNSFTSLAQFYEAFTKTYEGEHIDLLVNNSQDAKVSATKIMSSDVDAVVILEDAIGGPLVTKELKMLDTKNKLVYYYDLQLSSGWPEYKKIVGDANKLNGAHTLKLKSGDMTSFTVKYKTKYGTDPTPFAEYGYDSTKALLDAYNTDNSKWIGNIQKSSFDGPSGKVSFDKNGVRIQEVEMMTVQNGSVTN